MSNIDLVLLRLIKQKSQSAYDIKKNTIRIKRIYC